MFSIFNKRLFERQRTNLKLSCLLFASALLQRKSPSRLILAFKYFSVVSHQVEELSKVNIFLSHHVNVVIHTFCKSMSSRVECHKCYFLPRALFNITLFSPTSCEEKCVQFYIPCAKDKPTNRSRAIWSGNMFKAKRSTASERHKF